MRYGSVCSGIEAASVAWHPLGWEPQFFSEIEAFPSAVLKHHYPTVPNHGDMTKFKDWPDHAIDLLVGGTPCQSFSVAGLRAGLADPRGNLALTYLAIAAKYQPRWLVWENVPGVLSADGGEAFGSILGGMVELGYGVAYRVLDAQFCRTLGFAGAVPQRRRRVFVVGYLGDWRRAAAVLFDGASLRGDPSPRRQAGKATSGAVAPSLVSSGRGVERTGETRGQDPVIAVEWPVEVAPTLNAHFGDKMGLEDQHALHGAGLFVPAVTNALTNNNGQRNEVSDMVNGLIAQPVVPEIAASLTRGAESAGKGGYAGRRQEDDSNIIALQAGTTRENPDSGPDGIGVRQDGAAYTIEARAEVQAVAFSIMPMNSGKDYKARVTDVAQPVMAAGVSLGNQGGDVIAASWAVRRLTPVECCRLQGFPDDHLSQVKYRGKAPTDGPIYKALGNSMAVNVMRVLGQRIQMVDEL